MKSLKTILAVGTILVASTAVAFADPVSGTLSTSGDSSYNRSTAILTFLDGQTGLLNYGTFSSFSHNDLKFPGASTDAMGNPVYETLNYGNFAGPEVLFTAVSSTGEKLTYTLTGVTSYSYTNGLEIVGTGFFTETCKADASASCVSYSPSVGNFDLTTQGSGTGQTVTTFSNTQTAVTPEPNSLILLGTGLVTAAGAVLRKRRTV